MASYNELIALIDAFIKRNGVQAITGQILNGVLKAMVDQVGRGYAIMGVATPSTNPGTPDAPESWFASTPGTYTNFGGLDQRPVQMYAVEDEEKRLVFGVVMRADFPIYRRDERLGEYYVVYKPDTIRRMAEKYLADGLQNETSTMHQTDVDRVQMVQWFIKDEARGVVPQGFDVPDGSLFAEFHVLNDEVWAAVKDGTYKGFSLEGVFDFTPEEDPAQVAEMIEECDGVFEAMFKKIHKEALTQDIGNYLLTVFAL